MGKGTEEHGIVWSKLVAAEPYVLEIILLVFLGYLYQIAAARWLLGDISTVNFILALRSLPTLIIGATLLVAIFHALLWIGTRVYGALLPSKQ